MKHIKHQLRKYIHVHVAMETQLYSLVEFSNHGCVLTAFFKAVRAQNYEKQFNKTFPASGKLFGIHTVCSPIELTRRKTTIRGVGSFRVDFLLTAVTPRNNRNKTKTKKNIDKSRPKSLPRRDNVVPRRAFRGSRYFRICRTRSRDLSYCPPTERIFTTTQRNPPSRSKPINYSYYLCILPSYEIPYLITHAYSGLYGGRRRRRLGYRTKTPRGTCV